MTDILLSPDTICEVPGFDPREDVLVVALPEDAGGGLDHALSFRRLAAYGRKRPVLEVELTHHASGSRFRIRLPGLSRLSPASVAVLSLEDAGQLAALTAAADSATLTGEGLYPPHPGKIPAAPGQARKMTFVHRHGWHLEGPPAERFFDLSNPASELTVTLEDDTGGPIYAIRLTENRQGDTGSADRHRSIVLAQTAPGTPPLSTGLLAEWFARRLGSDRFRAIAWIWLGNEGYYTDPDSQESRSFGAINRNPLLAINGKLTGSIAIER